MTIQINDLDQRFDKLIEAQPARLSRTSLATAIIEQAIERFEQTGDPNAWQNPLPQSSEAQPTNGHGRTIDNASADRSPNPDGERLASPLRAASHSRD